MYLLLLDLETVLHTKIQLRIASQCYGDMRVLGGV
jgi:hypothetical protein